MSMRKLTVAIPVFNNEKFIKSAIDSILRQTFKDFTLLIIDDGSTDNTVKIIKQYTDKRIKLIQHSSNKGRPEARNTALDAADSEYFAWMDGDDISHPYRLEKQLDFLENNKHISICGAAIKCFQHRSDIVRFPCSPQQITAASLFYSPIANPTAMMRLIDIRNNELHYDTKLKRSQDFAFWVDAFWKYNLKGFNLREELLYYRTYPQIGDSNWSYHKAVLKEHLFPIFGFNISENDADIHSCLVYMDKKNLIQKYGIDNILFWLSQLYTLQHIENSTLSEVKKLINNQILLTLLEIPTPFKYIKKYKKSIMIKLIIKKIQSFLKGYKI